MKGEKEGLMNVEGGRRVMNEGGERMFDECIRRRMGLLKQEEKEGLMNVVGGGRVMNEGGERRFDERRRRWKSS